MEHQVHVGDIVDVTITGIQPYGAFALLPDGSSGLIHISEISDGFVRDVNQFVFYGEQVKVKVIDIVTVLYDFIAHNRTRSYKAHITNENIPQLWQFIKARFTKEFTNSCNARIIF